jgi:hypothetical protein
VHAHHELVERLVAQRTQLGRQAWRAAALQAVQQLQQVDLAGAVQPCMLMLAASAQHTQRCLRAAKEARTYASTEIKHCKK